MERHGDGIDTCLVCGDGVYSRGLCSRHHTQFHRRKKGMTQKQAERYEAALIDLNMLAPPKPTGRVAKDDPFAAIADKIRTGAQIPIARSTDRRPASQTRQPSNQQSKSQASGQANQEAGDSCQDVQAQPKRNEADEAAASQLPTVTGATHSDSSADRPVTRRVTQLANDVGPVQP